MDKALALQFGFWFCLSTEKRESVKLKCSLHCFRRSNLFFSEGINSIIVLGFLVPL